jgi:hypothetical protein
MTLAQHDESTMKPMRRLLLLAVVAVELILWHHSALAQLNAHRRQQVTPDFEQGLVPLFVLGDLNEDGVVDRRDRDLLALLVGGASMKSVSCAAAGDLDLNLKLDQKDLDRFDQWLSGGGVDIPGLTFEPTLPCKFRHLFVAARFDAVPGEFIPIRLLDPGLSNSKCQASIESGPASIEVAHDGKGFVVKPSAQARPGDIVTVLLNLKGRKYYYTFPIRPGP